MQAGLVAKPRSIWILNHYAVTPDLPGRTRHYELAREMVRYGCHVTIFASAFNERTYTSVRLQHGERWAIEEVDDVHFVWLPSLAYCGNDWRRVLNMLDFSWRVWWWGRRLPALDKRVGRPDLILGSATHLFAVLAAYYLSRFYRAHFVMEVRDLWPQSFLDTGQWREGQVQVRFFRWLEQILYARAERIIILSPLTHDYLARYSKAWADKAVYIPNGTRVDRFERVDKTPGSAPRPLTVMYLGAMGPTNGLEIVLEALRIVNQADPQLLRVVFVGDGPEKPRLQQMARQMGLHNAFFEEPVANAEVPEVASRADIFLLVQREVFYGSLTKLYDYMAAARPIVAAVHAEHNNPVERVGCGLAASPGDPQDLADKLVALARLPEAERRAMGERGRAFVRQHYDWRVLARDLISTLEQLNVP
jgi:glycosyltransferase involved in cell wall biosynthesis